MRAYSHPARDLRRERLVGNWGGASEHIGRRWEDVGLEALQSRIDCCAAWPGNHCSPRKAVPLVSSSLQTALSRSGLPSPDVIVVLEVDGGERALQALDFKWNLEFASYGQIRAEAVRALFDRGVAPLRALLMQEIGEGFDELPVMDGLLSAPHLPVNQWFLQSEDNGRQEYPIESHEVIFEDVDPVHFFGSLPGWEMATELARVDRSEARLGTLEGSEHYYRVGAGLLGAVAQLEVSVFVRQPPSVSAADAFKWLRARVRSASSMAYLQQAERLMSTRNQLQLRLRNAVKSPYRFSDLVEALKAKGVRLPDRENGLPPRERERWGNVLRRVGVEHKELIYRTGLRLVETGLSDAEALARLETDPRRYADRARQRAEQLVAAALEQGE